MKISKSFGMVSTLCVLAISMAACSQGGEANAANATPAQTATPEPAGQPATAKEGGRYEDGTLISDPASIIPTGFRGNCYEENNAPCPLVSTEQTNNGLLQVDERDFTYPVEAGDEVRVERVQPGTIRVTARFIGGEVGTPARHATQTWVLSEDAQVLTVTENTAGSGTLVLHRCVIQAQ